MTPPAFHAIDPVAGASAHEASSAYHSSLSTSAPTPAYPLTLPQSFRRQPASSVQQQQQQILVPPPVDVPKSHHDAVKRHAARARPSKTGAWLLEPQYEYNLDAPLAEAIAQLLLTEGGAPSILDIGSGKGVYVRFLRAHGLRAHGIDGARDVTTVTNGLVQEWDLTRPLPQPCAQYDWVMSLEVAEHIPRPSEDTYLRNVNCSARTGVVVSWAPPGQAGNGHVNLRTRAEATERFRGLGFEPDEAASVTLRAAAKLSWFRRNTMVMRRAAPRVGHGDGAGRRRGGDAGLKKVASFASRLAKLRVAASEVDPELDPELDGLESELGQLFHPGQALDSVSIFGAARPLDPLGVATPGVRSAWRAAEEQTASALTPATSDPGEEHAASSSHSERSRRCWHPAANCPLILSPALHDETVEYDVVTDTPSANAIEPSQLGPRTLSCDRSALGAAALFSRRRPFLKVFIGILSAPASRERREAIRATWLQAAGGRDGGALGCFVIGVGADESNLPEWRRIRGEVEAEGSRHRDVLTLPDFSETGGVRKIKTFHYWMAVAKLLADGVSFQHALKTDDDALVQVPNLLAALHRHPERYLHMGVQAYSSFGPTGRGCGWAWGLRVAQRLYRERRCREETGNHAPFPFAVGMLQLASSELVGALAATRGVAIFYGEADARTPRNVSRQHYYADGQEDAAFGYWVSAARRERGLAVRYVHLRDAQAHNIGCAAPPGGPQHLGMYRRISDEQTEIVLHGLKRPAAMAYAWGVLTRREAPNATACAVRVWGVSGSE